jgi:hypothetical protein
MSFVRSLPRTIAGTFSVRADVPTLNQRSPIRVHVQRRQFGDVTDHGSEEPSSTWAEAALNDPTCGIELSELFLTFGDQEDAKAEQTPRPERCSNK